jgi:hypothetical protein
MAHPKRFSIAFLMAITFLTALYFSILNYLDNFEHSRDAAIITLPIISLLILTVPRMRKGPFWIGVQATGWIIASIAGYIAWADIDWLALPLEWTLRLCPGFEGAVLRLGDAPAAIIFYAYIAFVYTTPMIVLSLMGGWLAARGCRTRGV